ncbi:MAG: putative polysaccharide biosynthesis protein [Christensenellales bacterium]
MSKKSFVKGAVVLGAAGLLVKVIGALYRIPLTRIIGESGMGLYQLAYPIYSYLLVISTAGLPTAISRMVAEQVTVGNYEGAKRIFRVSFQILFVIGLALSLFLWFGSTWIAELLGDGLAALSVQYIAPALFFVSLMSAFRGYFQGMQVMGPTAVSQLVEQIGKLIIGLYLASMWMTSFGAISAEAGISNGAAGAMMGVTLSEVAAVILLIGVYQRYKSKEKKAQKKEKAPPTVNTFAPMSFGSIGKQLAKIAIPVTIGASIMPLVGMIDAALINNKLTAIGFSIEQARSLYGLLTGVVNTLVNMPAVLTVALAMSLVPAIAESRTLKDDRSVRAKSGTGLKLAMLVGLPCGAGLAVLAKPIINFLYPSLKQGSTEITVSLLAVMAVAIFFLSLVQTMTGVMQGLGRVSIPVINLLIGAVVKLVISFILLGIPEINIMGATIGTIACYAVAGILNTYRMVRITKLKFSVKDYIAKPVVATGLMSAAAYFSYSLASSFMGRTTSLLIALLVSVIVYVLALVFIKALNRNDLQFLPGGGKLERMLDKFSLL